ncbi:hypothetical protein [Flavobacterium pallidum]|uniref:Uncharacterized protein n=1 Tax=Flavobacterium pallidum TaxID=2172098 RepID=A0A2S1SFW5_9FLAO|nr:hypothetical protein [Flavobacterium pallidum]AWI25242.1 hypothetical protein HYN49_04660 [Flavobacterium pallidum]
MELNRIDNTCLFVPDINPEQISFAYYFSAANINPIPSAMTLAQSWNDYAGAYVFFGQPVKREDFGSCTTALQDYFSGKSALEHTGILWVADINKIKNPDASNPVFLISSKTDDSNDIIIKNDSNVSIGSYRIPIFKDSPIDLVNETETIIIGYPKTDGAQPPAYGKGISIPLSGRAAGTIVFEGAIGDCSDAFRTGWNVGLKYYYPDQNNNITQLQYPVFETKKGDQLFFNAQWDPLHPVDSKRTFLHFKKEWFQILPNNSGGFQIATPDNPGWLPSTFRTIYGNPVFLVPDDTATENFPALVFQPLPKTNGNTDYYLAPSGDFCMAVREKASNAENTHTLVAGVMGTEYISFIPATGNYKGDRIRFTPNNAAFAQAYPLTAAKVVSAVADCLPGALLCDTYMTSWMGFYQGDTVEKPLYHSQPESSPLFLPSKSTGSGPETLTIMDVYPAASAAFPPVNSTVFPMVPYAGAVGDKTLLQTMRDFEISILNPSRRKQIAEHGTTNQKLLKDGEAKTTTTPQGLLATISGFDWSSVLLAQNLVSGRKLEFTGSPAISSPIQQALQSNQLFMVISSPHQLGAFQNEIDIEGWPFMINPQGSDNSYSNVLIFKFCDGSLKDRASDTQTWTNSGTFNDKPDLVSQWLTNYINDATDRAASDARFQNFVDIVTNDGWNGILALQVDIGLDNFPDDLRGLLGGIDLTHFNGHHFGIQVNYIKPDDNKLTIPKSSLFGLISYYDAAYALANGISTGYPAEGTTINPGADGYNFAVLYLQVVFDNSSITDFNSLIEISATNWFGEPAFANCTVQLIGSYEEHNGKPTYSFTTKEGQFYQFYMNSQVLNYVQIVKARFNTNINPTEMLEAGEEVSHISSTFSFWGYLNFVQLDGVDMFSFGDEVPTPGSIDTGLYFYNLAIQMNMDLIKSADTPPSYSIRDRVFDFTEESTSFDTSLSTVHDRSLYPNFPLTITSLTSSKAGTAEELGYVPLQLPNNVDFEALGDDWFGLVCTLNLGSMGALAAQAGFTARILLAWSASADKPAVMIGIRLPGTGGAKGFSFQNVLQLSTEAFVLNLDNTTYPGKTIYSLWLRSIGMSFLGVKFPPGGTTNLILYGNPDAPGEIGWYGSYLNS